jgi:glycosyltransferase involved in cell wall biosynthesis
VQKDPLKVLVLAHVPPPFHGQSYMVRVLLDCFRSPVAHGAGDNAITPANSALPEPAVRPVECVHVDFRLSDSVEDIGRRRLTKLALVLGYCVKAIRARLRHGVDTLLYVPAPALRHAIYRDWLVMLVCRPFFRRRVFWWHATGLGDWLNHHATPFERWITQRLLAAPDLSLVLGAETEKDARQLRSRRIALVPNAIPDPCPELAPELVRDKAARRASRREWLEACRAGVSSADSGHPPPLFRLLFIGLCYREKGLFDAVEAVARANRRWADGNAGIQVQLDVAGRFFLAEEQREFEERVRQPDLQLDPARLRDTDSAQTLGSAAVRYHGFVDGEAKARLFREADCLVFPTYYAAESFGLVLIEAMAHGLDVITTRWHNIPELLPSAYPGLVEPRDPAGLDAALDHFLVHYEGDGLRRHYEQTFALSHFQTRIRNALQEMVAG